MPLALAAFGIEAKRQARLSLVDILDDLDEDTLFLIANADEAYAAMHWNFATNILMGPPQLTSGSNK